jgi:hypothetical protein
MDGKKQLLCTFVKKNKILQVYTSIINNYTINNQITLYNIKDSNDSILVYDIIGNSTVNVPDTISVHKKSHTDTYYTINALNDIIKQNNNGTLDLTYKIDWNNYNRCLLLYNNQDGLKILKLVYVDHISFE